MPDLRDRITIEEALATDGEESTAPDYLAWKKAKIARTLERIDRGDGCRFSLSDVKKRYGIDA
jgi:hypothetical protein